MLFRSSSADLDSASFTAFDVSFNYQVGIYISGNDKVIDSISELLGPLNYFFFSRLGLMNLDIFTPAVSVPVATVTDDEIIKDGVALRRTANSDETRGVPVYNVNYKWGKNYTIQKSNDVYGVVTDDVIAFTSLEFRTSTATDVSVQTVYPLSPELTVESLLYNQVDADIDAVRILESYKIKSNFYTLKVESQYVSEISLNDVVELIINRFGFENGELFKVTGLKENAGTSVTTLELYG